MINKLYDQVKKIFKRNYKLIIIATAIYFILTYNLPYFIFKPGGLIDISDRITVENEIDLKGSYNLTYVSQLNATIPTYILSKIFKNWDLIKINEVKAQEESLTDLNTRNDLLLQSSLDSAMLVAFDRANQVYNVSDNKFMIIYVDDHETTNLKVGDELLEVAGHLVTSIDTVKEEVSNLKVGESLKFKIKRSDKTLSKQATVFQGEDSKKVGILILNDFNIETEIDIDFDFKKSESGPSGGFITALDIYTKLIKKDLTQGLKIAGTGTIDRTGNVGSIDGIKYKVLGAIKNNADIFFAPAGDNYKKAKKILEKENSNINLVAIKTIDDAINYLKSK